MLKSLFAGCAALVLSAGVAVADEWEAVAMSDGAAMAVDWDSLRINGNIRQINTALVARQPEAGQFDWATSLIDIDCSQTRYKTVRSSFFFMDGGSASEDFVGDGSWTSINPGALVADVRNQVCAASPGKKGYFPDPLSFAVAGRKVLQEQ